MKPDKHVEARRLRRDEGKSVKEIAKLVGCSKSSASMWVRDTELTLEQKTELANHYKPNQQLATQKL